MGVSRIRRDRAPMRKDSAKQGSAKAAHGWYVHGMWLATTAGACATGAYLATGARALILMTIWSLGAASWAHRCAVAEAQRAAQESRGLTMARAVSAGVTSGARQMLADLSPALREMAGQLPSQGAPEGVDPTADTLVIPLHGGRRARQVS